MDSSMGKMCLGKDVIKISSDRNEGSGDWDSPEYKDTTGSGGKKEPEALVFHKMDTEEDSDRYIAQCFVNGLYASDGEINLEKNDNLITNNYAVKLCLEYEVRKGKKLVEKELMVSFLRSANAMVNFGEDTITIQPDFDPFLLSSDEEGNPNLDNLETFLDFDFDEVPQTKTDLPPMVCKLGKGRRPIIGHLANIEEYWKLLDEIWADKVILDGKIKHEEERAMVKVKGQMLKEKKDLGAFIFPIRLEGLINENALADTGSDTNTMPYRIYEQLGRDDITQEERNITMINYTEAEVLGRLVNVLCQVGFTTLSAQFLILEIPIDRDAPIVVGRGFLDTIRGNIDISNRILTTFDGLTRQTFRAARSEKIRIAESDSDDEEDYVIKRNDLWLLSMFEARHQNGYANVAWVIAKWIKRKGAGSQKDRQICCGQFITKIARKSRVLTEEIVRTLSTPVYCRDLDRTTLRELIDSEDRLIPDIPVDDVPRVSAQRAPRVQRALMQDLYERMGSMEIRQEAIERMDYRQAYHWDRYEGVFEHMEGVYNVPLHGDYNPPGKEDGKDKCSKISIRRPRNRENKKPRDSAHTLAAANFKGIRFTCEATITRLREVREWHYTSCNQCNKNESEQEELMQKYRAAGHRHIPKEIVDIIGKKHAFHIHFGFGTGIGSGITATTKETTNTDENKASFTSYSTHTLQIADAEVQSSRPPPDTKRNSGHNREKNMYSISISVPAQERGQVSLQLMSFWTNSWRSRDAP
ncbi:retrovirus-related pol polyprotein from transposon TNT 1-94 [Tanacetum coccineum]